MALRILNLFITVLRATIRAKEIAEYVLGTSRTVRVCNWNQESKVKFRLPTGHARISLQERTQPCLMLFFFFAMATDGQPEKRRKAT